MKFAKFLRTPISKNIYERVLLYRGCGCDVDDVKRKGRTHRLNNKTQAGKERTDRAYKINRRLILMK